MKVDEDFAEEVTKRSGQNLNLCYQCLKCSVGCPLSPHMEFRPNTVIRRIQYGEKETILKSHAIWLCVSCMTCGSRCPNDIDISAIMDTLREMCVEEGYAYEAEHKVVKLHESFVDNVKMWGRLHEVTFFIPYLARTLDIANNAPSAVKLLARGKLPILPKQIDGIDEMFELYEQAYKTAGQLDEPAPSDSEMETKETE